MLLLAAVPDAPENYFNVKSILAQLDIEALEFTVSGDVKIRKYLIHKWVFQIYSLVMILVGKSPGKPKFGCPMCSAFTPYTEDGTLYKLSDLLDLHEVLKDFLI